MGDQPITIECSPDSTILDIYKAILRKNNVIVLSELSETTTQSITVDASGKALLRIPIFVDAGGSVSTDASKESTSTRRYEQMDYNLAIAGDVADLLQKLKIKNIIILENFHYLSEEVQRKFSFDLRTFQDVGIRFIVLGIWRERNRLTQFNGDLQDRIIEVAVEPWEKADLQKVISKGSELLNVDLSGISNYIIEASFDSIGVLQELCKASCLQAGVYKRAYEKTTVDKECLTLAIKRKVEDYGNRHLKAFESFCNSTRRERSEKLPLFIPYYFIMVLLHSDFNEIVSGFKRRDLQDSIAKIHHRPEEVRASDMSNFLYQIIHYQIERGINPPLFDYDRNVNKLRIIDSTLYFFLRNCDKQEVAESITKPHEKLAPDFSKLGMPAPDSA